MIRQPSMLVMHGTQREGLSRGNVLIPATKMCVNRSLMHLAPAWPEKSLTTIQNIPTCHQNNPHIFCQSGDMFSRVFFLSFEFNIVKCPSNSHIEVFYIITLLLKV